METNDDRRLMEKLQRIEAMFADRAATVGEKAAAGEARDRILRRLEEFAEIDPPVEYTFTFRNRWPQKWFAALLRRYNLRPHRYAGRRCTTVMARVSKRQLDESLRPEFRELDDTLQRRLSEITERVIAESINQDASDVEVRSGQALPASVSMEV
jgi:hypothetical protein